MARDVNTVYRSAHRPKLFMGADRELMLGLILLTLMLVVVLMSWPAAIAGTAFWLIASRCLQLAAKHDPLLRQVYFRHQSYQRRFSGRSTPWAIGGGPR